MDPGYKPRKNPSDNADLGFQAVGPALRWLRIMRLNVEGLSAVAYQKKSLQWVQKLGAMHRWSRSVNNSDY